jgi:hypothetical protein
MLHRSRVLSLAGHMALALWICLPILASAQQTPSPGSDRAPLKKVEINAPSNQALKQMLAHADQWATARSSVGSLVAVEGTFKAFSDPELESFMQTIRQWNISLDLEVGGVKEWCRKGDDCFAKQKGWWDRIIKHGGEIDSFVMDGPRAKVIRDLQLSEDYAVEQVARFVVDVHKAYPRALVADIEPYPSQSTQDHIRWIDRLRQRLYDMGDRGLDFYRIDLNWVAFQSEHKGSWAGLKAIEDHCHARHIPFSLIYWASDFPLAKSAGHLTDKTWYDGIMKEGAGYASSGAVPDQYVIESWIGLPKQALPETGGYTFTQSVRDFTHRFVR